MIRGLLSIASVLALSACAIGSSDFACRGYPQGTACMSAIEVYEATDGDYKPTTMRSSAATEKPSSAKTKQPVSAQPTRTVQFGGNVPPPDRPVPVLTDPEVMRIYVAPWKDQAGNLNAPGLIFAEITPRTWNLGIDATQQTRALYDVKSAAPDSANISALASPGAAVRTSSTPSQPVLGYAQERALTIAPPPATVSGGGNKTPTGASQR